MRGMGLGSLFPPVGRLVFIILFILLINQLAHAHEGDRDTQKRVLDRPLE